MAERAGVGISGSRANATLYLHTLAHIVVAWLWVRQARVATAALGRAETGVDTAFYRGKLAACRNFYRYELAKIGAVIDLLVRVDTTCLTTDVERS